LKAIELVVELSRLPPRVTDQEAPDGRPVSVSVTAYVDSAENVIDRL
jgi:hypothetical protein